MTSSRPVLDLAAEIANGRETEIPIKLLKLKGNILAVLFFQEINFKARNSLLEIIKLDDLTKKIKYDIYNFDLLEALVVSFKHEYNHMKNGWNVAVELVKIFR